VNSKYGRLENAIYRTAARSRYSVLYSFIYIVIIVNIGCVVSGRTTQIH